MNFDRNTGARRAFALVLGLFLGLCLWKFGDPVILDHKITPPVTASDYLEDAWPTHWANYLLAPLAIFGLGVLLMAGGGTGWRRFSARDAFSWLWLLPLIWLAWQFLSATHTVAPELTVPTLWQMAGCVISYFAGWLIIGAGPGGYGEPSLTKPRPKSTAPEQKRPRQAPSPAPAALLRLVLIGVLAAFAFCLVRAVNQRLIEYPASEQMLEEGERSNWTNFPPAIIEEMKTDGVIITTNGVDVANPVILAKFVKRRVCGTMVYPNALAQLILLLWPLSLALAWGSTHLLRPWVRMMAIFLTIILGGMAFFWTGSKLGWLISLAVVGVVLLRLKGRKKLKLAAAAVVLVIGLGVFAVRFHDYFAAGATSVGARFDYWRAAVTTTVAHPLWGTGPGTFQRPYAEIKSPTSEMARLAHNDYLEQFSDSGVVAGLAYTAWIVLALIVAGSRLWRRPEATAFAVFIGVLGWFLQAFGEFGLYVPALAWTAFVLLGWAVARGYG